VVLLFAFEAICRRFPLIYIEALTKLSSKKSQRRITMKTTSKKTYNSKSTLLLAVALIAVAAIAAPMATAAEKNAPPPVTIAQLAGSWKAAINTNADCGAGVHVLVFTLDDKGSATDVADTFNTTECGQGEHTDQTFTITSLSSDGSGTATYSNAGLPLNLTIQVNPAGNVFILADTKDAGQYWAGTAVKQ
jgi:hypothetical protein